MPGLFPHSQFLATRPAEIRRNEHGLFFWRAITMGLQRRTIQKLLREDFLGNKPFVVRETARDKVAGDIKAMLERFHDLETKDYSYIRPEEKPRSLGAFTIVDPEPYYYHGGRTTFRLLLDDSDRLTIKEVHDGDSALVSDLDEVVRFIGHCNERIKRQKALKAQKGKVRDLLAQAILAQVRKLAKEERFDFMSETDAQKLNLFVKLSDDHAVVLHIPFKDFKQFLPQLRSAISTLRQLYQNGIRFQIVGRRALPWKTSWVSHETL